MGGRNGAIILAITTIYSKTLLTPIPSHDIPYHPRLGAPHPMVERRASGASGAARDGGFAVAKPRFIGKFVHKIDRKGRVSVPAPFRGALVGQTFVGVVCFPSPKLTCIEGGGTECTDDLIARIEQLPQFSDDREILQSLLGQMHEIALDGEGRVMLPPELLAHGGITDHALFVGHGSSFRIWEPERFGAREADLYERARRQDVTVPPLRAAVSPAAK